MPIPARRVADPKKRYQPGFPYAWLIDVDSEPIQAGVELVTIWVTTDRDIWESEFSDEPRLPRPDYELERIARNGPKWGPGIEVDVVVGVQFESGTPRLVRAPAQMIHRTD